MTSQLRAEFKKLLTVRSTYISSFLVVLLTVLLMFAMTTQIYQEPTQPQAASDSKRPDSAQPVAQTKELPQPVFSKNLPPTQLQSNLQNVVPVMSLIVTITVILLMAHEYRYNTVMHTLTLANRRWKVLASKIAVGVVYTVVMTAVIILATAAGTELAASLKDLQLPAQDLGWLPVSSRLLFYTLGYSMLGLAIVVLVRNLVASIVAIFILPMIEQIGGLILASHQVQTASFLPFAALGRVMTFSGTSEIAPDLALPSVAKSAVVFLLYLLGIWVVAWYFFHKRDAN